MKRYIVHDTTDITADSSTVVNFAMQYAVVCLYGQTDGVQRLKMVGKGFVLFEINSSPSAFYIIKPTCIVIGF